MLKCPMATQFLPASGTTSMSFFIGCLLPQIISKPAASPAMRRNNGESNQLPWPRRNLDSQFGAFVMLSFRRLAGAVVPARSGGRCSACRCDDAASRNTALCVRGPKEEPQPPACSGRPNEIDPKGVPITGEQCGAERPGGIRAHTGQGRFESDVYGSQDGGKVMRIRRQDFMFCGSMTRRTGRRRFAPSTLVFPPARSMFR
jgi:hypothetical protein